MFGSSCSGRVGRSSLAFAAAASAEARSRCAASCIAFNATVTLLVRGDSLSKSMSDYLIGELRRTPNVFVRLGVELIDGEGEEQLETIVVRDRAKGDAGRAGRHASLDVEKAAGG